MTFHLTQRQGQQAQLMASDATHIMGYGGSRCLSGDAVLDGHSKTIADLAGIGEPVRVFTTHGWQWAEAPFRKGEAEMLRFRLWNGREVTVTSDHRFWNGAEWQRADAFSEGDAIAVRRQSTRAASKFAGPQSADNDIPNDAGYQTSRVAYIDEAPRQPFFTLHVPGCEHYFANGILHHNSGKTFGFCRGIAARAMLAPGSRHAIFRFRFNHIKASIIADTWPKMMDLAFPGVDQHSKLDKTDWYYEFPNSSQVWFAGLDDKERVEKVLGQEYATLFFNECSQIPYASRVMAISRLAQNVLKTDGQPLRLKAYYDMNPIGMAHWTYRLFVEKRDPDRRTFVPNPENYAAIVMNPEHNKENLPATYLQELDRMPEAARRRFFLGQFANISDSQLWSLELLDQNRIMDGQIPQLIRVVVAIDPSGARGDEDLRSDECGIVVVGLGVDGRAYLLEDLSGRMGPADWAAVAVAAYDRHKASQIVAETNYGGAMVAATIKAAANSPDRIAGATLAIPVIEVTASRGKVVRAEPIAALYEMQKVSHVGHFEDLEDQLQSFTTNGYIGTRSPDRGDALVWALTALFPALTRKDEVAAGYRPAPKVNLGHSSAKARMLSRRR